MFVGIDGSLTHTGIVRLYSDGGCNAEAWKPPKDCRGLPRLLWYREKFHQLFYECQTEYSALPLVALEGYSFNSKNSRPHSLGELGAAIKLAAYDFGYSLGTDFLIVPPSVLKKFVTGKGNASKVDMVLDVNERWGFRSSDDNIVDAYALARFVEKRVAAKPTKAFDALWLAAQNATLDIPKAKKKRKAAA